MRQIGTNALPCLVKWIQYESPLRKPPTGLELLWVETREKLPIRRTYSESAGFRRANAGLAGFRILGEQASPAIPQLVQLFQPGRGTEVSYWAGQALQAIGDAAIPSLVASLLDHNCTNRVRIAELLSSRTYYGSNVWLIGEHADLVVRALTKCLKDEDRVLVAACAKALGELRIADNAALDALRECKGHTDNQVREAAHFAMVLIEEKAAKTRALKGVAP